MAKRKLWMGSTMVAVLGGTLVVALAAGPPADAKYVGSQPSARPAIWPCTRTGSESKHAKNFSVLQGAEKTNPECVKCHITGYGKPSGFTSGSGHAEPGEYELRGVPRPGQGPPRGGGLGRTRQGRLGQAYQQVARRGLRRLPQSAR